MIVFSDRNSIAGSDTSTPTGASPTTVAAPPGRSTSQAWRIVAARPTTSNACSTPPLADRQHLLDDVDPSPAAHHVRRAAADRAARACSSSVSTATMIPAPASRAPAITCRPTPPHPITHTLAPTRSPARLTAPIPVTTPQPSSAACHSGIETGQPHGAGRGHDRVLREARHHQAVLEHGPVDSLQPRAPVHQHPGDAVARRRLAQRPPPGPAGAARAARGHEAERHVVAGDQVDDVLADRLDHARALVAEHHRPPPRAEPPVGEVDVGMTHAGGRDPHQHLAAAGRGQHHGLGRDRPAGLAQDAARI